LGKNIPNYLTLVILYSL